MKTCLFLANQYNNTISKKPIEPLSYISFNTPTDSNQEISRQNDRLDREIALKKDILVQLEKLIAARTREEHKMKEIEAAENDNKVSEIEKIKKEKERLDEQVVFLTKKLELLRRNLEGLKDKIAESDAELEIKKESLEEVRKLIASKKAALKELQENVDPKLTNGKAFQEPEKLDRKKESPVEGTFLKGAKERKTASNGKQTTK